MFTGCSSLKDITVLNAECNISIDESTLPISATIHGYHSSTAYKYAMQYNRSFVLLDEHTIETEFTLPASCSSYGFKMLNCKYCDYKTKELIKPMGHNYVDFTFEPTCTQNGYTKHYCVNCGDEYIDSEIKAPGHTMRKMTVKPTCTENGCDIEICDICRYNYETNIVKAAGHKMTLYSINSPTCTEDGYTSHTCATCGDTYSDDFIPALGHTDSDHDGKCDTCEADLTEHCTCNCHKTGISGFFFKIKLFFWKLFRNEKNRYCECGKAHW